MPSSIIVPNCFSEEDMTREKSYTDLVQFFCSVIEPYTKSFSVSTKNNLLDCQVYTCGFYDNDIGSDETLYTNLHEPKILHCLVFNGDFTVNIYNEKGVLRKFPVKKGDVIITNQSYDLGIKYTENPPTFYTFNFDIAKNE
jgi:hypothetical protein